MKHRERTMEVPPLGCWCVFIPIIWKIPYLKRLLWHQVKYQRVQIFWDTLFHCTYLNWFSIICFWNWKLKKTVYLKKTVRLQIVHCSFNIEHLFIYFIRYDIHTQYNRIQFKSKSYSFKNKHRGHVALTDAQSELKWVKN